MITKDKKHIIEQELKVAVLGMYVTLDLITFDKKSEKQKTKIKKLIDKIQTEKGYNSKTSVGMTLTNEVLQNSHSTIVSPSDITKSIENVSKQFNIDWSIFGHSGKDSVTQNIISIILPDPKKAMSTFVSNYTEANLKLEQIEKSQPQKQKNESDNGKGKKSKNPDKNGMPNNQVNNTTTLPEGKEMLEHINQEIDKSGKNISNRTSADIIDYFSKIDGTDYYGEFYSQGSISKIIQLFYQAREINAPLNIYEAYDKITKMGLLIVEVMKNDLLNGENYKNTELARFVNQFEPDKALENYEKVRNQYFSLYNKLSDAEKIKLDNYSRKSVTYQRVFDIDIMSGNRIAGLDDLKKAINVRIKKEYTSTNKLVTSLNENEGKFSDRFKRDFFYSLRLMNLEEIVVLYEEIKNSMQEKKEMFGTNEENTKKQEELFNKRMAEIQKLCVEAIYNKMNKKNKNNDSNEKIEKEVLQSVEKEFVSICKDYLKEEPLFTLVFISKDEVEEGYARNKYETKDAINEAKKRFYNMSKLEQLLKKLDFKKLERLSRQLEEGNTLSDDDVIEVNGMFRRK